MRLLLTGCGHISVGNKLTDDIMRTIFRFSVAVLMMLPVVVSAQKKSDPEGYLTYSLPSTTIMLEVEAVQESSMPVHMPDMQRNILESKLVRKMRLHFS